MSSNISTSCRQKTVMATGRSWIMTILLAGAFILGGSSLSRAQEQTPDPMMLLNLDLFAPPAMIATVLLDKTPPPTLIQCWTKSVR